MFLFLLGNLCWSICHGGNVTSMQLTCAVSVHCPSITTELLQGFLNIKWARWKRVLVTRSVAMIPCVVIALVAANSLDYLDEYINVEQSMLVSRLAE